MAKMTTSDAWQILLDKYDIKNEIESNGTFKITASQIKEVREPRLMAKWDSSEQLPKSLKKNKINILPVCGAWTYSEDTCPFCRMNGVLTELEYDGAKAPEFFDEKGNKVKCHLRRVMSIRTLYIHNSVLLQCMKKSDYNKKGN